MDFTRFEKLRLVIERLGASQVVANLEKSFLGEGVDIDNPERVVAGEHGIYYIGEDGTLTKVIIHIVDKDIKSHYARGLAALVDEKKFNSEELIEASHKYHLVRCKVIERAENEGWKHKYKMSRRRDGTFFYRYIDGAKIIKRDQQTLNVCKVCLAVVNDLLKGRYTTSDFLPKDFLDSGMLNVHRLPNNGEIADTCPPNMYPSDWDKISLNYRKFKKYQCEDPSCPYPDLSSPMHRKYLHTHHVSLDKTNNGYSNLSALCIYCHAMQPNHDQVRNSPDYKDYIRLRSII